MSKAAIDAYARANSGVNVNSLLRRIDAERRSQARRTQARGEMIQSIGSLAQAGVGAHGDFKVAKAGGYDGSFINFMTASPSELSPFIERGKTAPPTDARDGLLGTLDNLGRVVQSDFLDEDEELRARGIV